MAKRRLDAEYAALVEEHKALQDQQAYLVKHPRDHQGHALHLSRLKDHTRRLHALTARFHRQRMRLSARRK